MTVDSTRAEAGKSGFFHSCNVAHLAQLTMKRVDCYIRAGLPTRVTSRPRPPPPPPPTPPPRPPIPGSPRAPPAPARAHPLDLPLAPRIPRQHPRAARSLFQLVMRNVSARSLLAVK